LKRFDNKVNALKELNDHMLLHALLRKALLTWKIRSCMWFLGERSVSKGTFQSSLWIGRIMLRKRRHTNF